MLLAAPKLKVLSKWGTGIDFTDREACKNIYMPHGKRGSAAVDAILLPAGAKKEGKSITDEEMQQLNIQRHSVCPTWNYSFKPRIYDRPYLRKI